LGNGNRTGKSIGRINIQGHRSLTDTALTPRTRAKPIALHGYGLMLPFAKYTKAANPPGGRSLDHFPV